MRQAGLLLKAAILALSLSVLVLLPSNDGPNRTPPAFATPSGATLAFPPNHDFEAGISQVGNGPTNYDFSSSETGWTKVGTGSVTYPGGVATMSGSVGLTSSLYTSATSTQGIKIRYRYPASSSAQIAVYNSGGSAVGTDDLSCTDCTAGQWTEKYLGIFPSVLGQSVRIKIIQTSGTTEVDEFGTQWLTLREWRGTSVGIKSQPKLDGDWLAEVRSTLFTGNFHLTENRIEFDYAFPLSGQNQLTVNLYRASDNLVLTSKAITLGGAGWTRYVWTWGSSDYTGQAVYIKFWSADGQPTRIDNVGSNFVDGATREDDDPSVDAGDPVDTSTGQSGYSHTDIIVPGKGIPLAFTRSYHSMGSTPGDLGYNWRHNYSTWLRIDSDNSVAVNYGSGGAAYFKYNAGSYTPPASVHDTLVKNGDGTYTLTTVRQVRYNFSSAGRLTAILDRNNNTTTVSYDGNGFLSQVQDAGGRTLTFTITNGRITQVQDPLNRTVGFQYDGNGDLVQVTDVKSGTTTYAYGNHRMTSLTDSNNHLQNQNIYDSANRVVEQTNQTGGKTCFYYGTAPSYTSAACPGVTPAPAAGQTVVVDARGNKTTYDFDTKFRTTSITDQNGGVTSFAYDSANNRTCITDPLNNRTGLGYDAAGNVTQVIDALNTDATCGLKQAGVKWTFTYTAKNDVDLATDPLGRQTDYIYDTAGNLTRVVPKDAGGAIKQLTCFELNTAGLPIAIVRSTDLTVPSGATDPCTGSKTKLEYDQYGNRTAVVDARFSGQQTPPKTSFTYDLGGRALTVTNELSHTTTNTYDGQNKNLTTTDNLNNTTAWTYDAKGNLKTVVDANRKVSGTAESGAACGAAGTGNGTDDDSDTVVDDGCPNVIYSYDNADRLIQVIDALGNSTTYGYDAAGNRINVTNAKRQAVGPAETGSQCGTAGTGNGTDDDGDTVVDDGCPSSKFTYDALNRLQSSTDALGRVTSYQYDAASNLTQRTDPRNLVTKYFPDALNRQDLVEHWNGQTLVDSIDHTYNAVGFRTQMVDSTGTTTFTPDALDRLASVTFPGPKTVSYTYDDLPGGSAADYPGQRTVVTYPDSKTVTYTYLANGAMNSVTDWLTRQTSYTYDNARRLTKTQYPNTVWTDYGYDNVDRLTSVVNKKTGPITLSSFTYALDATGNRTQMADLSGTHSYQYDALYRLTQVTYPGPQTDTYTYDAVANRLTKNTTSYTYDAADEMLTAGGVTYGYDNNGNQTGRGIDTFAYDHENRLTQTVIGGATSTSTYNGDGLRMSHTVSGQTTNYTWDVNASLPVVLQDGTSTYVYGLDLISATDGSGNQTYFTYDGLGSTTDLTNGGGTVTDQYSYDAFGAVRSHSGGSPNYWQFTGEQQDADSGLYFLRARYYDPATGRFLGKDPLPIGNRYSYVSNNPVNGIDPSGMCLMDMDGPRGCGSDNRGQSYEGGIGEWVVCPGGVIIVVSDGLQCIPPSPEPDLCDPELFGEIDVGIPDDWNFFCWDDPAIYAAGDWLDDNVPSTWQECLNTIATELGEDFALEYAEERGWKLPGWLRFTEAGVSVAEGLDACTD